ncbi:ubiquinone/menaquinone biosynthesis C-methylase UbiE [Kribbella sp. VKM Ac-2527]|uniref:Ubiquinone/menaquinone biosynthesis C-methylase UbiE n=1 Tax=Kribbella caucasensis TaxID=2512215 RepID=A0A4R6KJ49_9ACTN|nr:class I SAM-dependent methyltransferase [Kribbella sp. VKM Ac-2527]TDO51298.1 ubiquinone/menaquinone biosynthesis C-methylase UbiE [Kribbella sp. VKM Ac-2527]
MADLTEYYRERAPEYDAVYAKPERAHDLGRLRSALVDLVAGKSVLEVAAGTGYWTAALSTSARSILATDVNEETLAIARTRQLGPAEVRFQPADVYRLDTIPGEVEVIFAGFFWSHVLRADIPRFANGLAERVGPGGLVVLADNRYVEGSNYPITRTTDAGDTYQARRLADGREYEVLKNFPTKDQLLADLSPVAAEIQYEELTYFWLASCRSR